MLFLCLYSNRTTFVQKPISYVGYSTNQTQTQQHMMWTKSLFFNRWRRLNMKSDAVIKMCQNERKKNVDFHFEHIFYVYNKNLCCIDEKRECNIVIHFIFISCVVYMRFRSNLKTQQNICL